MDKKEYLKQGEINLIEDNKWSFKRKLCTIILILIGIILLILIIFTLIIGIKYSKLYIQSGYEEPWNDLYGNRTLNIPYFKNNQIINSFKKNGDNYNETMGEINDGKNYTKNERNYYDLYIPYSSTKNKDKYNGIILFIHGGSWQYGDKNMMSYLCSRYAKMGYITATLSFTLLGKKESNIFRILDEITSCIESIKEQLKSQGFNENKLGIAIGGTSSGALLAMLYSYSIKKSPIPIKFVINNVGPVSLEPEYWYKLKNKNKTLENIEPDDIEKAINNSNIVKIFDNEINLLKYMNLFIGKKYNDKQLKGMIKDKKINVNNDEYKKLYKIVYKTFPYNFINKIPTLCIYGGNDFIIGVAHYSKLKKLFKKNIELVYMRYGGHMLLSPDTENGLHANREMHYQILNFSKTYFKS